MSLEGVQRWQGIAQVFRMSLRAELREFYLFQLLFSLAFSMIVIFEPVFFYQEGFSLSFIALYYAVHYALYVFMLPLGAMFAARYGLERALIISLPIFILYFIALSLVPEQPWLIWAAVILLTVHKTFYWPAFHAVLSKFGDAKNRGTEISWLRVLRYGIGILGPIIGGFVAAAFGFPTLFLVTAGVVMVSAVPMLRTKERFASVRLSYAKPWKMILEPRQRNVSLAMLAMGENLVDLVYWPVFMFIILGSTSKLGLLAAVGITVMTLITFFVGEMADRVPRRIVLRMHLPFLVISYLFRPLAGSAMLVMLTDTLGRMSFTGVNLPLVYKIYRVARRNGVLSSITAMEMVLAAAKAAAAVVLIVVFAVTLPYTGFTITFGLAAVWSLLYLFL